MNNYLRKLRHLRDPELFALRLIDRIESKLDRPETWIQLRRCGLTSNAPLSFHERRILRDYIFLLTQQSDFVIYDIGANVGDHTVALSKLSNVRHVVAFEPLPQMFAVLQSRIGGRSKIAAYNVALGNDTGEIPFFAHADSLFSSPLQITDQFQASFPSRQSVNEISVPIQRLDDLRIEHDLPLPNFVKLDVQGYESEVLKGGLDTIGRANWLQIELNLVPLYEGSNLFHEQYHQIASLGYELADIRYKYMGEGARIYPIVVGRSNLTPSFRAIEALQPHRNDPTVE